MPLSNILIKAEIAATLTAALDLGNASAPLSYTKQVAMTNGTGALQADRLWHDKRTIAASATDSLDLIGGGLVDALGATFGPVRLRGLLVVADAGNTNNVVVTRPASNGVPMFAAAGDAVAVKPGGVFMLIDPSATGVAVTAGTGDLIDIVNSAGGSTVTYDVVILGASA